MMAISLAMFAFHCTSRSSAAHRPRDPGGADAPAMVSALGHDVPGVFVLVFAVEAGSRASAGVSAASCC
jgi:hypothetical protein